MACDAQTLVNEAVCIECNVPQGMYLPILIALFCQIVTNGGGGGGGGVGLIGVVNPNGNVTAAAGSVYTNKANSTLWVNYDGTINGWQQFV